MDKTFRLSLRVAVGLILLAGAGLIAHSVWPRTPRATESPPADAPPAAAETPATEAARGPDADQTIGPPPTGEPDVDDTGASVLLDFAQLIRGVGATDSEAMLTGPRAVFNPDSMTWRVLVPLLTAEFATTGQDEGVDVLWEEVRVTAEEALLDLNEATVLLERDVRVAGEDFELLTEQISYRGRERTLSAEGRVDFHKHELARDERRHQSITISGEGLSVDMGRRRFVLDADVETHLHDVSRDFLASESLHERPTATADVIITADGRLSYDDLQQAATFNRNVVATFAGRVLRSDKLVIHFESADNDGGPEVTDIIATGNVTLTHEGQKLSGDSMEWRSITQTGVLRGDPALVETPGFDLSGSELTFYRMNDLFHTESPGRLEWKETNAGPATAGDDPSEPQVAGPFHMRADRPVTIAWTDSLRYDVETGLAVVRGSVVVEQDNSSLTCNQLEITLQEESNSVNRIVAQGNVGVRDALSGQAREAMCDRLVWDAAEDTVELTAAREGDVTLRTDGQTVSAPRLIFNNATGAVQCPEGGRLSTEQTGPDDSKATIEVTWRDEMEYRPAPESVATFAGEAVARRGDEIISGERLRLEFDESMDLVRILAEGNAVVDTSSDSPSHGAQPAGQHAPPTGLTAARAQQWRMGAEAVEILPAAEVVRSDTPGTIEMLQNGTVTGAIQWQERMSLNPAQHYALFVGAVEATMQGTLTKSRELRLNLDEDGQLRHITARDEVFFSDAEGGWEVKAESAEAVFAAENALRQLIARGDVRVTDESRSLYGRRVTLFLSEDAELNQPVVTRAVAEGEVWVWYQEPEERLEAGGDRLEWQRDTDTYLLTGDPYAYLRRGDMKTQNWKIFLDRTTGRLTLPPGDRPVVTTVGSDGS